MKPEVVFRREIDVARRAMSRNEFEARHNYSFWVSSDIAISEDLTLQAHEEQHAPVEIPGTLLAHFSGLPIDTFSYLQASTRSRYAQVGINVSFAASQEIVESLPDEAINFSEAEQYQTFVRVENQSDRPVKLASNSHLFRLYSYPIFNNPPINCEGKRLLNLISQKGVELTGEEGKDWKVLFDSKYTGEEGASGILLPINPDNRMWIPPHPYNRPLEVPDNSGIDFRKIIDQYFAPIPMSTDSIHWVGETSAQVKLGEGVHGLLERLPSLDGTDAGMHNTMPNINSFLIDSNFSNTIRTEIFSPTDSRMPNYVFLRLFKDPMV